MRDHVGIAGGTGALGRGLAARLAIAGVPVHLASRDPARGRAAAEELATATGGSVSGGGMDVLGNAEIVLLAVPFDALESTLEDLAPHVTGRIVVSAVNPMAFDDDGPYPLGVADGSAAAFVARRLPESPVAAAFHTLSSRALGAADPMDDDGPVFGDDPEVVAAVIDLVDRIEGCRGVFAGRLRLASVLESLTPVLISVNRHYRAHAGVRFSRLPTRDG